MPILDSPDHDETLLPADQAAMARLSHQPGHLREPADVDAAVQRFAARMATLQRQAPRRQSRIQRPLMAGVGAAMLCGLALFGLIRLDVFDGRTPATEMVTQRTTHRGQRLTIDLPDGTRIVMGPESQLSYARDFGTTTRAITLTGEAYFDVGHHSSSPFVVRANGVQTRVLGTRFGVRAYAADSVVRVAVQSGRVAVDGVVLNGGDVAMAGPGVAARIRHQQDVASVLAWTNGALTFTDVPLTTIVTELERWYDLDIQLGDTSLVHRRLTGTFATTSASDLIASLEFVTRTNAQRTGRTIVLSPR